MARVAPEGKICVGLTNVDIEIANVSQPDDGELVSCLVDSGALYSIIPSPILARLGIQPLTEQLFRLADGKTIRRKKGGAVFRYRDRVGVADVVFGEPGDANLLGVVTLESLGLGIDPVRHTLIDLPMVL